MFLRFARTTPVAALAPGARVVVEGRIEASQVLQVSGTEIDCIYHETSLEEFRTGVRGGRAMWTPASHEEELAPFFVNDDAGRILVAPSEGSVKVKGGRNARGEGSRRGQRYVTRYIAPGDVVRVRGIVREKVPQVGKKKKKKDSAPPAGEKRLEISGTEGEPLVILFRRKG